MAINDISLTAGMRSNLLSLQNTVDLLNRTQNRLSSGKKVNTAIDNPVSFFAAQTLNARASIIDGLKDSMGQAVQTIAAADKGITSLSALIEQAKGLAQSAQSAAAGTTPDATTGDADLEETNYVNASITFGVIVDDEMLTIGGQGFTVLTVGATAADGQFGDAGELVDAIMANTTLTDLGYSATLSGGNVIISLDEEDVALADITSDMTGYAESEVDGALASVSMTFTIGATAYNGTGATATDAATALDTAITGGVTGETAVTVSTIGAVEVTYAYVPSAEMTSIADQYNTLRTQMDELAEDSGYKGKNLLSSDLLTVKFEGTTLGVQGFDASTTGLAITAADAAVWGATPAAIDAAVTALDTASNTLRSEASKLSGNLSIITVRQNFSTQMINTLNAGSDLLTLADANEEGANMLMLQTRQSLSTTALSLSAQAAQSVLKLFQ